MAEGGALRFASADALSAALRVGLVPVEVAGHPVSAGYRADGAIDVLDPHLPIEVREQLERAGAARVEAEAGFSPRPSWLLAVPPRRERHTELAGPSLFFLPDEGALLELCEQLVRLGAADFEVGRGRLGAYVRMAAPPHYAILRASEPGAPARVLHRGDGAQGGLWVERGLGHPLADRIAVSGGLVLVLAEGCVIDPAVTFVPVLDRVELGLPAVERATLADDADALARRVHITPRLARDHRGAAAPPALWILREGGIDALDAWVGESGEHALESFEVAVALETVEPIVLVRARRGARAADVPLAARAYARVEGAPQLHLPIGARIHPPLAAPRLLRALGDPPPTELLVIDEHEGGMRALAIDEEAFRPLSAWAELHLERAASELAPWMDAVSFDLAELHVVRDRRPERAAADDAPLLVTPPPRRTRGRRSRSVEAAAPERPAPAPRHELARLELPSDDTERAALEEDVLSTGASLASPSVARALRSVGRALVREGDSAGAIACDAWSLLGAADAPAFARARLGLETAEACVAQLTDATQPEALALALVGAQMAASSVGGVRRARIAEALLDPASPIPTPLLVESVGQLSALAGGDALLLSRLDDRVRSRLGDGLLALDVPPFVRRADRDRAHGALREASRAAAALDLLREVLETTPRALSVEPPWEHTLGYLRWVFAIGMARLGALPRARALRDAAHHGARDGIDTVLEAICAVRYDEAMEQRAPASLPSALRARIASLPPFVRYKVDRVLEAITTLGAGDARDAFRGFQGVEDPRALVRAALEGAGDAAELAARFDAFVLHAEPESARAIAWATRLLPASLAAPRIQHLTVRALERAETTPLAVLGELARSAASHEAHGALERAVDGVQIALDAREPDEALTALADARALLGVLAASGRRDDALRIGRAALERAGDDAPLIAALDLESTLASLGAETPLLARRIRAALGRFSRLTETTRRLRLAPALARALRAGCDDEAALSGLQQIAASVAVTADAYQTGTHLSISVCELADALVSALSADEHGLLGRARPVLDASERALRARLRALTTAHPGAR